MGSLRTIQAHRTLFGVGAMVDPLYSPDRDWRLEPGLRQGLLAYWPTHLQR